MVHPRVEFLRGLGYLHKAAPDVTGADFEVLTPHDEPVIAATQLYQEMFKVTLDEVAFAIHGREAIADGLGGPATNFLLDMPRCTHPDFEVPFEDDPVQAALWSKDEANWPAECRDDIGVGRDFQALPSMDLEQTNGVYWALCHNWSEAFADIHMTPHNEAIGDNNGTRMYHRVESMGGSVLAYHYLARNRCGDRLDGAWNSRVSWNRRLASATGSHEVGHGLGLNHVNDPAALLYPSITNASMNRHGYPNATDIAAAKALGYAPHADWQNRQLPEGKLFLPRDSDEPDPIPTPDLEERIKDLEQQAFEGIVTDATHEARFAWLAARIKVLEEAHR